MANLDEDGVRDPDVAALTLPDPTLVDQITEVTLRRDRGGPNLDVYALGAPDTVHAASVFPDQVNLEGGDGDWESIALDEQPGGGWSASIPTGSVLFPERLGLTTPVQVTFSGATITSVPIGAQVLAGAGEILEKDTVAYTEVLPGTDFIYSLTARGYKELVVLKDRSAASTLSYAIVAPGMKLEVGSDGGVVFSLDGRPFAMVPPAVAWDSSSPSAIGKADYTVQEVGPGAFVLTLTLDPAFAAGAAYPVTIDPGNQDVLGLPNDDTWVDQQNPGVDNTATSGLRVTAGTWERRSFVRFNTNSLQRDDRIVYEALLYLYMSSGTNNGPMIDVRRVTQAWPSPITWNAQPSVDTPILDSENCGACSGWISWDVGDMYQHVLQTDIADPWTDYGLRASTSGTADYLFQSAESAADPRVLLSWNDLPAAPSLDVPASGFVSEDDTPTLKVQGGTNWPNDPNNDDVLIQFQISTDPNDFTAPDLVWESPWLDSRSYVVPSGVLTDGQTYYWRARSWDVCYNHPYHQMCSYTDALGVDHERNFTPSRELTIVLQHLGEDERWAMWSHELGNAMTLNVNEANGNVYLEVPLESLATAVGDLGIGLTYNSQQDADYGLSAGWDLSIGPEGSMRDLPIELVKLTNFPDNGVKIRFRGGRTSYFPHRDHRVFATVTAGAGTVRQNADDGFVFVSPEGDTYEFSSAGRLLSANPVAANPASGTNAIKYTYDVAGQLEKVTDPLGRIVNLNWSAGQLQWLRPTWTNETWTLGYNPTNGRLNTISVDVTNPSTATTQTETVRFSYHVGAQLPGGLLSEVDDAATQSSGETGWTITYEEDSEGNWRASQLTPPPGDGPTPLSSWHFQYLGQIVGSTAPTACVTDPLGTPDTSPPIDCNLAHQTIVDFNLAALPMRIAGPADQTGYWPVTTLIWDTNNNLACRREPAANAQTMITNPNPCQTDKLSTIYTYESEAPFRLLTVIHPSANPSGTSDRLKDLYQYDSDTNGANFNGLWIEKYENGTLTGIPADESVWTNFDVNWGTGAPPGLVSTNGFSLRWTGFIDTRNSWDDIEKVQFRITTADEGVSLTLDNKVLLSCLGTTPPAGSFNCGTNQPVKKYLDPGLHPITIEYSDPSGAASFRLEWSVGEFGSWQQIPTSRLQTNLGLLTREQTRDVSGSTGLDRPLFLQTVYSFPDDNAKRRHLPDSVAVTDLDPNPDVVRKTAFTYNSYGQVRTVTMAAATSLAATTTYDYTNNTTTSCMIRVTEPDGAITDNACDPAGDVTTVTQTVRAVAGTNHTTAQTRATTTEYDDLGRVTRVTTPYGGSSTTTYDLAGRPILIDTFLGTGAGHGAHAYTEYVYDDAGHLIREELPLVANPANPGTFIQPVIQHFYDWLDSEVRTIDERGKEWEFAYDAYRRVIEAESPSGLVTSNEYRLVNAGAYQHRMTVWAPPGYSAGVSTVTSYDVLDQTTSQQVGTLTAATYQYNVQGYETRMTNPAGVRTDHTYNRFGDAATMIEFAATADAATTTYTYDAAGRLQKTDGPRATPVDDSVSYAYDSQDRLLTATQNGVTIPGASSPGAVTTFVWNDADERIQVAQQMSTTQTTVRNWMYDPVGRMSSYQDARGTTTSTHELSGLVSSVTDPRGITLRFEFDNLGRLTRRYALQSSTTIDDQVYAFDLASNQLSARVVATNITITGEFDDDGRIWKVYQNSIPPTTIYAYSPSTGLLSSITDPAGVTSYAYNANNLLNDLTDPFSATHVLYTYDSAGRVTKRSDASGMCWTQTYENNTGRLDVRTFRVNGSNCNGTTRGVFNLGYDKASNVTSRAITSFTGNSYAGTYNYTYDGADRLLTTTGPAAFGSRTYSYDGVGNRTSVQVGTGTPVTTTFDAAGLPTTSSDGTTYTHDPVGDLTAIDRTGTSNDWFFTYSSWNQLTKAARTPTGTDVTYTLDALNRQLSRTASGSTATYTYQGLGETLAQTSLSGATTSYAHTPGGPLAQRVSSNSRYYLRDMHGDVVGWASTGGALVGTALYDPWGQLLSGTGEMATTPGQGALRYQADLADASTGQVDMLTRLYEPTLGRFTSRDSLFGEPLRPQSLNLSGYSEANPMTYSDPTGRSIQIGDVGGGDAAASPSPTSDSPAVVSPAGVPRPLSLPQFQELPEEQRILWLDAFVDYYGVGDWFEAIRGVLMAGKTIGGLLDPGTWSSWVDASIIHAISEGKRLQLGQIDESTNPGAVQWAAFFSAQQQPFTQTTELFGLWAEAESVATEHGRQIAASRGTVATSAEAAMDTWATRWRLAVRWAYDTPPAREVLMNPDFIFVGVTHALDPYIDPRLASPIMADLTMRVYLVALAA